MSRFYVGQKVIKRGPWTCVNEYWEGRPIHKGEIHEVRETFTSLMGNPCLLFVGIHNGLTPSGREFCYSEEDYDPISESSTDFVEITFEKIIQSTPKICAS